MVKKNISLLDVLIWLVGILVSLSVGFGMTSGTLIVPFLPLVITQIAGWIVVAGAILSVVLVIIKLATE